MTRRLTPVTLGVLSLLFALVVAVGVAGDVLYTLDTRTALLRGANIEHAVALVFIESLFGIPLVYFVRRRRRLLCLVLLSQAAVLTAAVFLVVLDGATFKERLTCGFLCFGSDKPYTLTHHLSSLYLLWGLSIGVLVVQALRVLRGTPHEAEVEESRYQRPVRLERRRWP